MFDRRRFLAFGTAAAAAAVLPAPAAAAGTLRFRWYGGGVGELAAPGDTDIVLIDAWIWNNAGFGRFNISKPAELSSVANFVAYLKARNPKNVVVALTHDHGDHAGDYFELLKALVAADLPVTTTGQSDLMRVGLVPKFKEAGLDPAKLVANGGAGQNFGGTATIGNATLRLVPAVHSTSLGFPAAGFIIDLAGTRVWASGDTDLFGDMALIGRRYAPQVAIVCAGGGPYTMRPTEAAEAVRLSGARTAIPVHYGHNPQVAGPEAGTQFRDAVRTMAPSARAIVLRPGESATV